MGRHAKLINKLEKMDPNELVYLGFNEASFWIYIAPAGEMLAKLDDLNDYIYAHTLKGYRGSKSNIMGLVNELSIYYRLREGSATKKNLEDKESLIRDLVAATNLYSRHLTEATNWTHLKDRIVVSEYFNHSPYATGTSLLLAGKFPGKYAMYKEVAENPIDFDECREVSRKIHIL